MLKNLVGVVTGNEDIDVVDIALDGALDSLGESIAKSIVEARNEAPFTSKKDVLKRTKLNSTQFEKMNQMGVFGDLPEDSQVGLFSI